MQSYFTMFLIFFLTGGLLYPAAGPSHAEQNAFMQLQNPNDAHRLLATSSVATILPSLPDDPETRKSFVLRLIELGTKRYRDGFSDRQHPANKRENALVGELCSHVQFDLWDKISIDALKTYRALRSCVLDTAIHAKNSLRVREVAQAIANLNRFDSSDLTALATCFKTDRDLYFMRPIGPQRLGYDTLIGGYIYHLFKLSSFYEIRLHMQELSEVCAELTENEFLQVLKPIFGRGTQCKGELWRCRALLSSIDHPYMAVLQNIVEEMEERIDRWIKCAYPEGERPLWIHIFDRPLHTMYSSIIYRVLWNERMSRVDCAVLLEIFRNFYTSGEDYEGIRYEFGKVLVRLARYGIRPNARLFPHDPTDIRTLLSQWLSYFNWHYLDSGHVRFQDVVALLTEEEFDVFITQNEGTTEFNRMLEAGARQMKLYKSHEEKWEEPEGIKGLALKKLYEAERRRKKFAGTLYGKLLLALKDELDTFGKDSAPQPSYGHAYPAWDSPIYFKGSVFEHDEPEDTIIDLAAPSSSTLLRSASYEGQAFQNEPNNVGAQARRRTIMKQIKDVLCKFFGR